MDKYPQSTEETLMSKTLWVQLLKPQSCCWLLRQNRKQQVTLKGNPKLKWIPASFLLQSQNFRKALGRLGSSWVQRNYHRSVQNVLMQLVTINCPWVEEVKEIALFSIIPETTVRDDRNSSQLPAEIKPTHSHSGETCKKRLVNRGTWLLR